MIPFDCARVPLRASEARGPSVSFSATLPRPPVRLRRPVALRSSRQLRRAGAVTTCEARRVVEHWDGDCSDESSDGEHNCDDDCATPVSAGAVGPVSVAFLVQRSVPLRPPGGATPPSSLVVGSVSGSKRSAASSLGLRSRLCSSRSKSAIRWGIVLGTSDRAASSRATAAWTSLMTSCLRADCRVSPVPFLRAMRAPLARQVHDTTPEIALSFRRSSGAT